MGEREVERRKHVERKQQPVKKFANGNLLIDFLSDVN